jgi:hypothetical protein
MRRVRTAHADGKRQQRGKENESPIRTFEKFACATTLAGKSYDAQAQGQYGPPA